METLIDIIKKHNFDKINTQSGVLYVIHENCINDLEEQYKKQFAMDSIQPPKPEGAK